METFNNGDTVYLVGTEPIPDRVFPGFSNGYSESEDAKDQLELLVDQSLRVHDYDGSDHTMKVWYTNGNYERVSYWMFAERFTKNEFLHHFKQITDE